MTQQQLDLYQTDLFADDLLEHQLQEKIVPKQQHQTTHSPDFSHQPIQGLAHAQYRGVHWINASAGTGKTFTLSAMIIRLLCSQYLPKQMIVTTFTRKAVSELRQRIRQNLQDILTFFQQHRGDEPHQLQLLATQHPHPLFALLADEFHNNIGYLCERLNLALDQYDELYIGTLDSLTQKILREFRFETGQTQQLQLTEQQHQILYQITHDGVRAWIQQQPASIIQQLYQQNFFKSVDDYFNLLKQSLNFKSAEWKVVPTPNVEQLNIERTIMVFKQIDFDAFLQLSALQACDKHSQNRLQKIAQLQKLDKQQLIAQLKNLLELLTTHQEKFKFLAKASDDDKTTILNHSVMKECTVLLDDIMAFTTCVENYQLALKSYLIQYCHQHFVTRLEQQQETTFAEQTQRLVFALSNDTQAGDYLAEMIHERYPAILVDEFQDTNHDQECILSKIWLQTERLALGCTVMVGDDKQAIYNFRGGDMLIYRRVEQRIQQLAQQSPQLIHRYTLIENFRSTQLLVEQLQALFLRQTDFGEGVHYVHVYSQQRTALIEQGVPNPSPLRCIELEDEQDYAMIEQCTWQILQLLQQASTGQLLFDDGKQQRPINVNDIAVLSANNRDLDALHQQLLKYHIPVHRQGYRSVFSHFIARDVAHLLNAMLHPYQEQQLKRVLFSPLFGCTVSQVIRMEQSQQLSLIMQKFVKCRELWLNHGFSLAWQYALERLDIWQNIAKASQSYERERCIVNLRHLGDILIEYSEYYRGANHLFKWYEQQLNNPQQREWEMERQLSNSDGIQLLTIHKSKGLEFKIVFLLFANKKSGARQNDELIFSVSEQQQRVISLQNNDEDALNAHEERKIAEQHRLWYVALTRASCRIYALLDKINDDKRAEYLYGVDFWRNANVSSPLQEYQQTPLDTAPDFRYRNNNQQQYTLLAEPVPTQRFALKTKTSFSRLTASAFGHGWLAESSIMLDKADDEQRIQRALAEQHLTSLDNIMLEQSAEDTDHHTQTELLWIQRHFPKGAQAGTLLHHILEQLDFADIPLAQHHIAQKNRLYVELERCFKHGFLHLKQQLITVYLQSTHDNTKQPITHHSPEWHQAEQQLYDDVLDWLCIIVSTPIFNTMALQHLTTSQYIHELQFCLSFKNTTFDSEYIEQLFAQYGIQLQLKGRVSDHFLVGAIDLVCFDGQRYHVLDYKSNDLGDDVKDYQTSALLANMHHAQYFLQASLYLLALHRYLKAHLQSYQMQQHLGHAYYVYLRGMTGVAEQGVIQCPITHDLILHLDEYLGG